MTARERILVVKLADIGDAVLALPAVQALREAHPESRIDVLTTEAGASVFALSAAVDETITLAKQRFDHVRGLISPGGLIELAGFTMRLRRSRYSTVVLLHHLTTSFGTSKFRALVRATGARIVAGLDNGRGDFLSLRAIDYGFGERTEWEYGLAVAELLGADPSPARPRISVPADARHSAAALLRGHGITGPYAIVHAEVGDYSPARAWPVERFGQVARELVEVSGMSVVLVGVEPDTPGYQEISAVPGVTNLVGRTSFNELCAVIEGGSMVAGCDSSVAHLAAAFDRPLVTLFGPSNIGAWKPYGAKEHIVGTSLDGGHHALAVHLDLPCSPCFYTGFELGRPQGCSTRTCLRSMSSRDVASIVTDVARQASEDGETC